MKKSTMLAVLAASSLLFAEAYQVNTISAKQLGMGHTGAGQKLGAESMHFNPGGLGFLENKIDVSAGVTFLMPRIEVEGSWGEQKADKNVATPVYVYAGSNFLPFMSAGLSFTTPYGNSATWDKNWTGSELIQDISLKVFALQPTVAFNIAKIVSIGVGPTINFGNFEQSKALIGPNTIPGIDQSAASITLSGDAKAVVGVHAGVMVDLFDKVGLGISYRSGVKAKVEGGKADVSSILPALPDQIAMLDGAKFNAKLPLPSNMNIGASFKASEKLLFALDLQLVGWDAYDSLIMEFVDVTVAPGVTMNIPQNAAKKYEDAFAVRFGTQIGLKDNLDLRAGIYFDETPVPDDYLNPETPSTNKIGGTLGCSFRPIPMLSIDAAFLYVRSVDGASISRKGSVDIDETRKFKANYKVQAIAPSIGLSFKF